MSPLVVIAMLGSLLIIAALIFVMVLTAVETHYVPVRLHALQHRLRLHMAPEWVYNRASADQAQPLDEDGLAIFDSLTVAESTGTGERQAGGQPQVVPDNTVAPTLTDTAALPEDEALLFLRAEIGVQLGFDLEIHGTVVSMTRRQYRALHQYTALAFEKVESPENYLSRYGISAIQIRR